ncbi:MAG: type VI secretion system tip protein TssI/VgrG [Desulfonauticus sp.]|nr:type VI secretion system tip protein TssI/VgrG [Desulfonauticus sp.]
MLSRDNKFIFRSFGLERDAFTVVSFKGREGLSSLYQFDITLVSEESFISPADVIKNRAQFIIKRKDGQDAKFNGVIASFEQLHHVDEYTFYRAILVPKLWYLTLTYHNQVFLDKDVKEILEILLKDGGLTSNDYEFKIKGSYPKNKYVCQFNETHFNFMSRWCEREGLYYYFDQTGDAEKIVITDTKISHTYHPLGEKFYYSPPSGLDHEKRDEIIQSFVCKYNNVPKRVFLKDYNYEKPSLDISGSAIVDKDGIGDVYLYGEHFETPEEGNRLAKIRAEQILCTKEEYVGDSTIPYMQSGYRFKLENHYREDVNKDYLVVEVNHEGTQGGYLLSGISKNLSERERRVFYQNSFKAIPVSVQFRPEKKTQKPLIAGTLNAKIDAEGSGKYAELDEQGRYKVKLPFDISGRRDGKASSWIRMATPYAGTNHGMHFPLHKGTEVLISFINGDPDRPVIVAAVPNPETPSQVVDQNQTMNVITTSGGNKIHIQDQEGKQGILLHTPIENTRFRIGAPMEVGSASHGDSHEEESKPIKNFKDFVSAFVSDGGIELYTDHRCKLESGIFNQLTLGEHGVHVIGLHTKLVIGGSLEVNISEGVELSLKDCHEIKLNKGHTRLEEDITNTYVNLKENFASRKTSGLSDRRDIGSVEELYNNRTLIINGEDTVNFKERTYAVTGKELTFINEKEECHNKITSEGEQKEENFINVSEKFGEKKVNGEKETNTLTSQQNNIETVTDIMDDRTMNVQDLALIGSNFTALFDNFKIT